MKINIEEYYGVYQMRLQGKTFTQIGRKFKFSRQRAQKIFKDYAKIKTKYQKEDTTRSVNICELCLKDLLESEERVECEEGETIIVYHKKCWKKVIFN